MCFLCVCVQLEIWYENGHICQFHFHSPFSNWWWCWWRIYRNTFMFHFTATTANSLLIDLRLYHFRFLYVFKLKQKFCKLVKVMYNVRWMHPLVVTHAAHITASLAFGVSADGWMDGWDRWIYELTETKCAMRHADGGGRATQMEMQWSNEVNEKSYSQLSCFNVINNPIVKF